MATPQQEQIDNLFTKLDTQLRNNHTKRALKTTDEILKLSPGDADAVAVKAALLIDLGSNADALALIDANPSSALTLAFERAYCIYRLGRLEEALAALKTVSPDRAAASLQLEAQLQYRLGDYRKAIELYGTLFKDHGDESIENKTNVIAAYAAAGRGDEIPSAMTASRVTARDGFEIAFNAACGEVECGRLDAAEEQLQLARRVGEETLYEEDLEEDEVEAELAPVTAQLAYVAALQGRFEDASKGFSDTLNLESGDVAAGAVAAANLAAVLLRQRVGDRKAAIESLKALEPFVERSGGYLRVKSGLEGRLGAKHCEGVLAVYAAVALAANKIDVAREALRSLEKHRKGSPAAVLLHAALLTRDNKLKEAATALDSAAASLQGTPAALDAHLMRVQLAASRGDSAAAAEMLSTLPTDARDRPAVVATRTALLEAKGDVDGAVAVLRTVDAAATTTNPAAARWALRRLATLEAGRGNIKEATENLQRLVKLDPASLEDPIVLEMLPRLMACTAPAQASQLFQQLPIATGAELSTAEIDALEAAGASVAAGTTAALAPLSAGSSHKQKDAPAADGTTAAGADADEDDTAAAAKKRRRKRKTRYPKGVDPDNPGPPPDPERWLPKWQRSTFKKKRKGNKDRDGVGKGAQGAGRVDANLDRTTGSAPALATGGGASGSAKSSKKKGKGRR